MQNTRIISPLTAGANLAPVDQAISRKVIE